MASTAPSTHPMSACGPPIAEIMSGIVMKGPMPTIWDMLTVVAGNKPRARRSPGRFRARWYRQPRTCPMLPLATSLVPSWWYSSELTNSEQALRSLRTVLTLSVVHRVRMAEGCRWLPVQRRSSPERDLLQTRWVHKINGRRPIDILYQLAASYRSTVQSFCAPISRCFGATAWPRQARTPRVRSELRPTPGTPSARHRYPGAGRRQLLKRNYHCLHDGCGFEEQKP